MADDSGQKNGSDLPPKIDLRKQGILKNGQSKPPADDAAQKQPSQEKPAAPASQAPASSDSGTTQSTVRIKIPDMPTEETTPPGKPPAPRPASAESGEASAPKPTAQQRPSIRISSAGATGKDQPETIRIGQSPAEGQDKPADKSKPLKPRTVSVPKPEAPSEESEAKSKTSRVPLEKATALPQSEAPGTPKTIRIKPKQAPGKQPSMAELNKLGSDAADRTSEAPTQASKPKTDSKRETSRISLESALAADQPEQAPAEEKAQPAPKSGPAPKTIRLKRPGDGGTVKVQQQPEAKGEKEDAKAAMGKTARLDELPEEEEGATPTRRKTIRVKRPTARATVQGGGGESGAPRPAAIARPQPIDTAATTDRVHWIFPTFTVLSMLVLLTVIYMFSAQTFGPLVCGTRTSYGLNELNLAWPGKISR